MSVSTYKAALRHIEVEIDLTARNVRFGGSEVLRARFIEVKALREVTLYS
jgi:hypothetical protein